MRTSDYPAGIPGALVVGQNVALARVQALVQDGLLRGLRGFRLPAGLGAERATEVD